MSDKDMVVQARELVESIDNSRRHGYAMRLLRDLADKVEALRAEVKTLELTVEGLLDRIGCRNED